MNKHFLDNNNITNPFINISNDKIHQTVTGETKTQPFPRKISLEVKIPLTNMVFKLDVQYVKV